MPRESEKRERKLGIKDFFLPYLFSGFVIKEEEFLFFLPSLLMRHKQFAELLSLAGSMVLHTGERTCLIALHILLCPPFYYRVLYD